MFKLSGVAARAFFILPAGFPAFDGEIFEVSFGWA
jgi:hypothetical protein